MLVTGTAGPRTPARVLAIVCHFPSNGSRRRSSGDGNGAPNGLVPSSTIVQSPSFASGHAVVHRAGAALHLGDQWRSIDEVGPDDEQQPNQRKGPGTWRIADSKV